MARPGRTIRLLATVAVLTPWLSACGGSDGGGAVVSTPTPPSSPTPTPTPTPTPPPAGANTDLLGTLKSETFVNDAAQGTLSVNGTASTVSAGLAAATFVYQASTQSYTLTVGANSQTFGPSAIDPSQGNAAQTVYVIKSGNTTDSLTVTKPGTSGRFTYQYVGSAFWQSSTVNTNSGSGFLYGVAYGEPAPSASLPRTGQGQFGIDVIGATGSGSAVTGFTGQGTLLVDFATSALALQGGLSINNASAGTFTGTGKLASAGTFGGSFTTDQFGSGQMAGRFYGPAAQEVGGSFYTSGVPGLVADGVFLGRTQAATANSSFTNLTSAQLFSADRVRMQGNGTTTLGTMQLAAFPTVNFRTPFSLFGPDYTQTASVGVTTSASVGSAVSASSGTTGFLVIDPSNASAQAVRGGVYFDKTGATPFYDEIVFGFRTPAASIPTSGFAGYLINLDGTLTDPKAAQTSQINGNGTFGVDFSTGKITTSGSLRNGNLSTNPAFASFSGTGTLGAGSGGFTGTLTTTGGTTTYNGALQGNLFGSTANEVGGVLNATGGDGTTLAALFTGTQNANVTNPTATLATLTGTTSFGTTQASYTNVPGISPNNQVGIFTGFASITYDAATKSYTIASQTGGVNPGYLTPVNATLSPAIQDSANTNATFTAYSAPNLSARVFNASASNPAIQLTYTSFADVLQTSASNGITTPYPVDHFLVFGLRTNASSMPTTGTGTYSGVAYGRGGDSRQDYAIGGTGQLSVDFGAQKATTALTLNATPLSGGASQSLGTFTYSGSITSNTFTGTTSSPTGSGALNGAFFGPNATEVGAAFDWNVFGTGTSFSGAFVGKKN